MAEPGFHCLVSLKFASDDGCCSLLGFEEFLGDLRSDLGLLLIRIGDDSLLEQG